MKKIFLDANILIDLITRRVKIDGIERIDFRQLYSSTLSAHILFYVNKIKYNSPEAKKSTDILNHISLTPLTEEIVKNAYKVKYYNYEDTLQYLMALNAECNYILTRDKKDFEKIKKIIPSNIKIITNLNTLLHNS